MANIAIIGSDAQHASSTRLQDMLQAPPSNHACTLIAESSTQSLLSFDLIITTRVSGGISANSNILQAFNAGVPLICGYSSGTGLGIGATSDFLAGKIGLTNQSLSGGNSVTNSVIISNEFDSSYQSGDLVKIHGGNDFHAYTPFTSLAPGSTAYAASVSNINTNCSLAIAPKGGMSLLNAEFPAACAYAGFIYSNNSTYNYEAKKLILLIISKVLDLNLTAVISGFSLNEYGDPVSSDVYVYKHDDGSLFKKTTTNADGSYSVTVGKGEYFVVCNNQDRDSNPQVLGYIKGVE